jgi:poly-gamma-glutamate synthesis protein (capsule biosynthesis protein)
LRTVCVALVAAVAASGVAVSLAARDEAPKPKRELVVVAVGDVLFSRGVARRVATDGPRPLIESVRPFTHGADLALCNLECPLASGRAAAGRPIVFSGPPQGAQWLRQGGFNAVSLANNHALDQGREGLLQTMASLAQQGITGFGAGRDQADACEPRIVRCGGRRVALLGFTVFPDEGVLFDAGQPGTARASAEAIGHAVRKARTNADLVIASFHWGQEYQAFTSAQQRALGHLAVDSGADLVIGQHPHVVQGAELYHGRLIAYSLGNFVFDLHRRGADRALAVRLSVGVDDANARFEPVHIVNCLPERAEAALGQRILADFRRSCGDLGTNVTVSEGTAAVRFSLRSPRHLTGSPR